MDTSNQEYYEDPAKAADTADAPDENGVTSGDYRSTPRRRKKKKKKGLILFFVILILAAAAAAAWYMWERQKPIDTVTEYLTDIRNMDFDGMKSLLQSNDMSALDNADITTDAYSGFFKSITEKMSFDIKKTSFSIQNGTAQVTAHIKYVDGSAIYKEALTDFLKKIVSSAFAGNTMTSEEIQQTLASLLSEKAQSMDPVYAEEDITFPLIQAGGNWRIVSLDADTVRVMSGNFTNVQNEIDQSINELKSGDSTETSQTPAADSSGTIDMANDKFAIQYTAFKITEDYAGESCLLVYYNYSNNGSSASSAMVDVTLQAYQNGEKLSAAVPSLDEPAIDQYMNEVEPGQTVSVCQAFSLKDTSDVTLEAGEALTFGGGNTTSQILKLQ